MTKTFFILLLIFLSANSFGQIEIIAHRGASDEAPENTMAAINLAWELNADAVEIDIHLTSDNKIILMHNANTKQTSGKNLVIRETNSKELKKLDVGLFKNEKYRNERIPFFKKVLQTIPAGKKIVVEIKCKSEILPFLKDITSKSKKADQLIFIAGDYETIVNTKKMFPGNECYWCTDKRGLSSTMKDIADSGLDGLDLHFSVIDENLVKTARKYNLEVLAFTVDDPVEAKRLISLGVTRITTNKPGWLRSGISE